MQLDHQNTRWVHALQMEMHVAPEPGEITKSWREQALQKAKAAIVKKKAEPIVGLFPHGHKLQFIGQDARHRAIVEARDALLETGLLDGLQNAEDIALVAATLFDAAERLDDISLLDPDLQLSSADFSKLDSAGTLILTDARTALEAWIR